MIKKTFRILKSNPWLIIMYSAFILMNEVISHAMARYDNFDINTSIYSVETAASRVLGILIITIVMSILFISGFGNMISIAVKKGRCTFMDFLRGLNSFLGRILLSCVILFFLLSLFVIIISITALPIIMAQSVGALKNGNIVFEVFIIAVCILAILIYPCIMLWYPAIFLEDTDVLDGLRKSLALSKKCYWILVGAAFVSALPSMAYSIFLSISTGIPGGQNISAVTPAYLSSIIIGAVLSLFISVLVFVIYEELYT